MPPAGRLALAAALAWAATSGGLRPPLANAADPAASDDLRPGLVATYRDPTGSEVACLEPTVALALKPGDAPHPRLTPAAGSTARWVGHVNILRAGAYTFSATLRGTVKVTVAGKVVLDATHEGPPAVKTGPATPLPAGGLAVAVEYTRPAGEARLELVWSSPFFREEPLPDDALGHLPNAETPALAADLRREHGRLLAEERSCLACHRPAAGDAAAGVLKRSGPHLDKIGARVFPGWLDAWLADPKKLRPATVMPKLFGDDDAGRAERYAATSFLASLGGGSLPVEEPAAPPTPRPAPSNAHPFKQVAKFIAFQFKPSELQQSVNRGRVLFTTAGCVACHANNDLPKAGAVVDEDAPRSARPGVFYGLLSETRERSNYPLGAVGSKTRAEVLTGYLANPLATSPGGRMPHMQLQGQEPRDLANFLCRTTRDPALDPGPPLAPPAGALEALVKRFLPEKERAGFDRVPADRKWEVVGQHVVAAKGCANCHQIPGLKESPVGPALAQVRQSPERGCNAETPTGAAPRYGLGKEDRAALAAFLKDGLAGPGTPAPAYAARVNLKRLNCLNCHQRDGEGGLTVALVEQLRALEKAENADAVAPPVLTGVAHKLRTPWLSAVLLQGGRARPWMGLRMPQYGPANVGGLPEGLTALEAAGVSEQVHTVPQTAEAIGAGRKMVGKSGFGCISCHDIGRVANSGTRGPDLATTTQRVRYDWYRRWLEQPQRVVPGTRMPQVFTDGKSLLPDVLAGHVGAQADAMWAYCSLGENLPLPEGLEPPKGNVLTVSKDPVLLRTFLPDVPSARGVAVGYPGGVNLAFDAAAGRLAYAWAGNFLDVSPAWDNRGGNPAKPLGPVFWKAPPGNPWALTAGDAPPDFLSRAADPAFGARPPEGTVYAGPSGLSFDGYGTDAAGAPTFRYRVRANVGTGVELKVTETPLPLHSGVAPGLGRRLRLELPAGQSAWMLAAETGGEPKAFDAAVQPVPLTLKSEGGDIPAQAKWLVLPQGGERAVGLGLDVGGGSRWRLLARPGGGWLAVLRVPAPTTPGAVTLTVPVWGLFRADAALLKALGQ
jgi:mono/diheme cytochrome c family protein